MNYVDLIPVITTSFSSLTKGASISVTDSRGTWTLLNNTSGSLTSVGGFDKSLDTYLRTAIGGTLNESIQVNFPSYYLVGKYDFSLGYYNTKYGNMNKWTVKGMTRSGWVTLHEGTNPTESTNTLTFTFEPQEISAIQIICTAKFGTNSWGFDDFTLYQALPLKQALVKHEGVYKTYDTATNTWSTVSIEYPTATQFMEKGFDVSNQKDISFIKELEGAELLFYSELPQKKCSLVEDKLSFSVYDVISENPQVVLYGGTDEDVVVSTTTEPFDLYDELGDEVEILFYTEDEEVQEANLILEANWSPIDELDGDFEVVIWADTGSTAKEILEMTAIPKPQFVKLASPKQIYGNLASVLADNALDSSYRNEVRYFITDEDARQWYVWNKTQKSFKVADTTTYDSILKNGMTYDLISNISKEDWSAWDRDYLNIGVFLKDNPRDTIVSKVESVSYQDYLPRKTSTVEKASVYILNTTAKINLEFAGNVIKGVLSDDDLTRVQYRVLLNGAPYYPSNGEFTALAKSPHNIELSISSKDVKMNDWNTVKVEFQDFFGTTDYWATQFIGTYTGLMFKDIQGNYFSTEIGEVLKYLDFGVIIAGQTTIENEIILKNQYGYDVENIRLYTETENFPEGMAIEFSQYQTPFEAQPELQLSQVLKNDEELSFFVRLKTLLGTTPNANGSLDIIVRADKV